MKHRETINVSLWKDNLLITVEIIDKTATTQALRFGIQLANLDEGL